jgi:hypothetical protein
MPCFYSPPIGLKPISPGEAIQPTPKIPCMNSKRPPRPKKNETVLEVPPSLIYKSLLNNTSKLELHKVSAFLKNVASTAIVE